MKLLESRAVRVVLAWFCATIALKGLAYLVVRTGIPPDMVLDVKTQLAQLQADTWKLVVALIAKWAAEDFAKWIPVPPPERPALNVAGGDMTVQAPLAPINPATAGERK